MDNSRPQPGFVTIVVASLVAHGAIVLFCWWEDGPRVAQATIPRAPATVELRSRIMPLAGPPRTSNSSQPAASNAPAIEAEKPAPPLATEIKSVDMRSLPRPAVDLPAPSGLNVLARFPSPNLDGVQLTTVFSSGRASKSSTTPGGGSFVGVSASAGNGGGSGAGGSGGGSGSGSGGAHSADVVDQPPQWLPGNADPPFPERERQLGVAGEVVMRLLINEQGRVEDVEFIKGAEPFRQAVLKVAHTWKFSPARHQGRLIKVWAVKEVGFNLRRGTR